MKTNFPQIKVKNVFTKKMLYRQYLIKSICDNFYISHTLVKMLLLNMFCELNYPIFDYLP